MQAFLRLQRLGVCLLHSATLDKLDALSKDFDQPVLSWRNSISHSLQGMQVKFDIS